jgi:tRNA nucleotidyltransferase/poly(A) polymerase
MDERFLNKLQDALFILTKLFEHGLFAYFVGGCVRDILLEKEPKDIDIATSATPEVVVSLFPNTIPTDLKDGTLIVRDKEKSFEVTTFGTEKNYEDKEDQRVFLLQNLWMTI